MSSKDNFKNFKISFHEPGLRRVALSELQRGTTLVTGENDINPELEEQATWWSREELLRHIEFNPFAENNQIELSDFELKKLSMTPLTKDKKVWKRILKEGKGDLITVKNAILFHYSAYLDKEDKDSPFDSSYMRGKPDFQRLDEHSVLPGLAISLVTMRLGEIAEILIDPEYAYGELGCPPRVPKDAMILFFVEIINIFEEGYIGELEYLRPDQLAKIPFDELMAKCEEERISGNSYFKNKMYKEAAIRYSKAINFVQSISYISAQQIECSKDMLSKLFVNIAMAYIRMKKPKYAISNLQKALEINPDNIKALYHYANAKLDLGEYEEAKKIFKQVATIAPNDRAIAAAISRVGVRSQEDKEAVENLYRKMAGVFKDEC